MIPDMILYNLYYNMDFSHGKTSLNAIKLSTKIIKLFHKRYGSKMFHTIIFSGFMKHVALDITKYLKVKHQLPDPY